MEDKIIVIHDGIEVKSVFPVSENTKVIGTLSMIVDEPDTALQLAGELVLEKINLIQNYMDNIITELE